MRVRLCSFLKEFDWLKATLCCLGYPPGEGGSGDYVCTNCELGVCSYATTSFVCVFGRLRAAFYSYVPWWVPVFLLLWRGLWLLGSPEVLLLLFYPVLNCQVGRFLFLMVLCFGDGEVVGELCALYSIVGCLGFWCRASLSFWLIQRLCYLTCFGWTLRLMLLSFGWYLDGFLVLYLTTMFFGEWAALGESWVFCSNVDGVGFWCRASLFF